MTTFASPRCTIEVYPFEGGQYTLQGGQITSARVSKALRGGAPGSFQITLAPGGPFGVESTPDWTQIITPASFILIGMQRGDAARIVMAGVVAEVVETQIWAPGQATGRQITVVGQDFSWYFNSFNYFALTLLGLTAGTSLGSFLGYPSAGLPMMLSQGFFSGNPAEVADQWYTKIMVGAGAIMGKTFVPYQGNELPIRDVIAKQFETYPDVFIPIGDNFWTAAESSWMAKLLSILPHPWYECFVATATQDDYPIGPGYTSSGTFFSMPSMPSAAPAGPTIVGRVNPQALITMTGNAPMQPATIGDMDVTRWNNLDVYSFEDFSFLESSITFPTDEIRNYYTLNPTFFRTTYGSSNTNTAPFPYAFMGFADPASIHRYGFRPEAATTRWFADWQGQGAQQPDLNVADTVAKLSSQVVSCYHPTALMARAEVTMPLRPDIIIGHRFQYAPFKGQPTWDFYIEQVDHIFAFGQQATTSLQLCRGLPTSVYQDPSGLLHDIFLGNAQRIDGVYQSGLPSNLAPGLQSYGMQNMSTILGEIAQVFVSPQKL